MRKAERLFQIITLMRGRRTVITAKAIAQELEVSERTIYRDLQALMLSGVPIEGEAGVGYRLAPDFSLPPVMFTESELQALMLGVQMVKAWGGNDMVQASQAALDKIQAALPDQQHLRQVQLPSWLMVPDFMRDEMTRHSDDLNQAIERRQQITLVYQREDREVSERDVQPLGLIYWGKTWTLVGWCLLRDSYRMFRLDRIHSLTAVDVFFSRHPERNLQHYMQVATAKNKAEYAEAEPETVSEELSKEEITTE